MAGLSNNSSMFQLLFILVLMHMVWPSLLAWWIIRQFRRTTDMLAQGRLDELLVTPTSPSALFHAYYIKRVQGALWLAGALAGITYFLMTLIIMDLYSPGSVSDAAEFSRITAATLFTQAAAIGSSMRYGLADFWLMRSGSNNRLLLRWFSYPIVIGVQIFAFAVGVHLYKNDSPALTLLFGLITAAALMAGLYGSAVRTFQRGAYLD